MAEYIDRDAAIAVIKRIQKDICPSWLNSRKSVYRSDREKLAALEEIIDDLHRIPNEDVEPVKRGRWIRPVPGDGEPYCSACKAYEPWCYGGTGYINSEYCPNCGAKMKEE